MKKKFRYEYFSWLLLFCFYVQHNAYAIDLQPGELKAPKADKTLVQVIFQYSERGDRYLQGQKQAGHPEIQTSLFQLRLGRSFAVAGVPGFFYAQIPAGFIHTEGALAKLTGDAGLGDTAFMLALWPYANHVRQTYLGIAGYLIVPSGSYDPKRSINLGENRYRSTIQAGFQTQLVENLHFSMAFDTLFYASNQDFNIKSDNLTQQVLYTSQFGLRYDINQRYSLGYTYFYTRGGESSVNNVSRNDESQLHRYQFTGIANYAFGRITLQYSSDMQTQNGFIEDNRWTLRYTVIF